MDTSTQDDFTRHSIKNIAREAMMELAHGDHTLAIALVDYLKTERNLNINQIIRLANAMTGIDKLTLANTWLDCRRLMAKTIH